MQIEKARPPYVVFEMRAEEDRQATIDSGNYVAKDIAYAIITPQGSKDRIERRVDEWFPHLEQQVREERFEQSWLDHYRTRFDAWKKGTEIPENGHAVTNWPAASPAQIKTLLAAGVRTIEDMAVANEEVLTRLGMGGRALKERAIAFMKIVDSGAGKQSEEMAALRAQIENLQLRNESLQTQLDRIAPYLEKLNDPALTGAAREVPSKDFEDTLQKL